MADEQIRIDVTAEDDASKVLEQVADEAEQLERLEPEVKVGADVDDATRGIRDVRDDAEALSRQDTEILLRARIDDAKAALKAIRTDLEQTGDKAADTSRQLDRIGGEGGLKTRGNAIADLTGPLGEASGAASDFAGVFDGISDIAEDVAGKVGVSAATMTTAIGGIGIAIAAGAAIWTLFQQKQEKAREAQRKLVDGQRELNQLLREGNTAEAAEKFVELYGKALAGAEALGVSHRDVVGYINGTSNALDPVLDKLTDLESKEFAAGAAIEDARQKFEASNGSLTDQQRLLRDVEAALAGSSAASDRAAAAQLRHQRQIERTKGALDRMRGALSMEGALLSFQGAMQTAFDNIQSGAGASADDILAIKQSILDVADYAKLTPVQIATLLNKVDQGDLVGVKASVEGYYAANRVGISTTLRDPSSFDINEYRRRLSAAIGEVPVQGRLTTVRSGNTQIPV